MSEINLTMEKQLIKNIVISLLIIVGISFGQENTNTRVDEKTGKPILFGTIDRDAFQDDNYAWWFNSGYKFYKADTLIIKKLSTIDLDSLKITLVIGTWCSDSRREVPRLFKIIDELQFPKEKSKIFGVDRKKESYEGDIAALNIELVPTFIFYVNEKEIGRIIETPEVSLESDMLKILEER